MENIFWRTSNLSTDFKTGHVMTMFSYVYGLAANNLPSIRNATVRLIEAFESAISRHNVSTVNHVHLRGVLLPIIMKLHNLQEFGFPLYLCTFITTVNKMSGYSTWFRSIWIPIGSLRAAFVHHELLSMRSPTLK